MSSLHGDQTLYELLRCQRRVSDLEATAAQVTETSLGITAAVDLWCVRFGPGGRGCLSARGACDLDGGFSGSYVEG